MSSKININNHTKPYSIGIIGGGQLALMLTEAALERDIKVCIQTKSLDDPGALKADKVIQADPLQIKGNKNLINECERIIFENEWVKINKLKQIASKEYFIPHLDSLAPLLDRISQKMFIDKLNLPSAKWLTIKDYKNLMVEELNEWRFPLMAKSFKGGYDGKGNKKLSNKDEFELFLKQQPSEDWIIEEWVDYEKELALIGSRDKDGNIRLFPIVETFQSNNVCNWVLAPAKTTYEIDVFALNIFSSIINELDYVGVLGIEFFFGNNGLLINEIAPRTHNSGHFSIEACNTSQFDQQICISTGIQPPDIKMNCNGSLMINLLGLKKNYPLRIEERINKLSKINGANVHWYGKTKESFGRKMGHITFLLDEINHEKRLEKAVIIKEKVNIIWPSPYSSN
tara:strand:- start:1076 stop:2272 length:1197 start_codon:yes stop_codon:yes gene_type:complete